MSPVEPPSDAGEDGPRHQRTTRRRWKLGLFTLPLVVVVVLLAARALVRSAPSPSGTTTTRAGRASSSSSTTLSSRPVQLEPSRFAPGACVDYPPLGTARHLTVFLDAGHGGLDPGAVGTTESGATVEEAKLTLPVELDAMQLLRQSGFRVVVSRTRATTVARLRPGDVANKVFTLKGALADLEARDLCANLARADLLVGIYFDAGVPGSAGSITTWDPVRSFAAKSRHFAELLQADVLAKMNARGWQIPNGGVPPDTGLGSSVITSSTSPLAIAASHYHHIVILGPAQPGYFTDPSKMPGALIEPLFVTDPFEASIAAKPADEEVIASGIAQAVEKYFVAGAPRGA